jgi:hypothetical protein
MGIFAKVWKFRRVPLNRKILSVLLTACLLPILTGSCGSTRQLLGIVASSTSLSTTNTFTLAQSRTLVGLNASEQIFIIAQYSGGDNAVDVTGASTFVSSDPTTVTVSNAGVIEVIRGACDFIDSGVTNPSPPPKDIPLIGPDPDSPVTITATFENQTTTILVNENSGTDTAGQPCPGPTTSS